MWGLRFGELTFIQDIECRDQLASFWYSYELQLKNIFQFVRITHLQVSQS